MKFSDVICCVKILATNINTFDFCFNKIVSDSQSVSYGDIFICKQGTRLDGHDYIKEAIENGAKAVVCERLTEYLKSNPKIRYTVVKDTLLAEAKMLYKYAGEPAKGMRLIAVTGTNGKTSSAYMIKAIFTKAGSKVGMIGTVKNYAGELDITRTTQETSQSSMTTPAPNELYALLNDMKECGVDTVVLEASSHALSQKRLDGLHFDIGIFTNLSEDHLDYHKTFKDYRNAKSHLFELCDTAIINTDTDDGKIIYENAKCKKYSYGKSRDADLVAFDCQTTGKGVSYCLGFKGTDKNVNLPILGEFSIYNSLGAIACAVVSGINLSIATAALENLSQIPGRLERIEVPDNINLYIDYAHTPDALEKVLLTLKSAIGTKLITLFGCGGDREREKRPIMGRIAANLSDFTIVTEDNSRTEDSDKIISEIVSGINTDSYTVIKDRHKAIFYALRNAHNGDTVLLAGKGHEDYEIVGNQRKHFSEKEIIEEYYKSFEK